MIFTLCLTLSKLVTIKKDQNIFRPDTTSSPATHLLSQLRLVSSAVRYEANDIFFSTKELDLSYLKKPTEFLELIADRLPSLMRVKLSHCENKAEAERALRMLQAAPKLKRLTMSHSTYSQNFRSSKSMVQAVLPLLRRLQVHRRHSHKRGALDVFELVKLPVGLLRNLQRRRPQRVEKWRNFRTETLALINKKLREA